jgi:PAS domain S-box-containing protein
MDSAPATGPPYSGADHVYERRLREMNDALLMSSVRLHELAETAQKADALVRGSELRLRHAHAELRVHADELTRFNQVAVGRELRMIELKREVNDLGRLSGKLPRYATEFKLVPLPDRADFVVASDGEFLAPLKSILRTVELQGRPARPPDYRTENRGLVALAEALADSPGTVLQFLADTIRESLNVGSAGVSLLSDDEESFAWPAISGAWQLHLGSSMARNSSPCGDVLDQDAPLLLAHLEQRYPYFLDVMPLVEECLLVPFRVAGKVVGTIWAVIHVAPPGSTPARRFDAEDLRQLVNLGRFASAAYQTANSFDTNEQHRAAVNLMEDAVQSGQAIETLNVELRESEERFRALFASVPVAVYACDASGVVREFNRRAAELWGREPALGNPEERFCGSVKMFLPNGIFMPHEQCPMVDVLSGKISEVRNQEVILERPDGSRVNVIVNIVPLKNHRGEISGAINCFHDITERKLAEEALQAAGQRFRFLAEAMPQKIFTARPNGDMDYFNPQWDEFTGLKFEAIRDWGWIKFIHPDDLAENVCIWRYSIATGEPFHGEHRFRRADGEYRWHLSRALALTDAEGQVVMWVGSSTDMHEVKEADRRKNEFLAMLAHELRNPLAPIRNSLEILRISQCSEETVRIASAMMERQVNQMVRLVDDLLYVSRISRGKIKLRKGRMELASSVHHAVEAATALYKDMEHELTVTVPPRPIFLDADPTRIAQVVGNLLNNACKFTERGGHIWLTVEREGEQAVIKVRDTGIGIAASHLPQIFDMFMQADISLERSVNGLGIGLTLVKNLVEMHDGTVEVHSEGIGQGSEFVVHLPIVETAPAPMLPDPTEFESIPVTARRILVVDDNRDSAASLSMLLELTGNVTYTAYDGLEAIEAVVTFQPDVVLLDIGLPKLNGYEACRQIRELPGGKDIVVIAVTGWGQDDDRRKTEESGFDGHLVKPVDFSILTALLAKLLPDPS